MSEKPLSKLMTTLKSPRVSVDLTGVKEAFNERIPIDLSKVADAINEPIPKYQEMFTFAAGGIPLFLFGIQAVTGILLAFFYVPQWDAAYESVRHITEGVPFGWWVRGIHRWSANLLILFVFLHMIRTFIFGSYRKPREFTWLMGVGLLFVTVTFGFTGYSLIGNQVSYWASVIGTNIAGNVPVIGKYLLYFMRGGWEVTDGTLTRFFALHAWVMPVSLTLLVGIHVVLVRLHGPTRVDPDDEREIKFWPDQIVNEVIVLLYILILIMVLTTLFPPHVGERATPEQTPLHIAPEWYFLWVYGFLKLVPGTIGMLGLMLFVAALVFWPWVDKVLQRISPRLDLSVVLGTIVALLVIVAIWWQAFFL